MPSVGTLSSKGQITIPAWVRRELGLEQGARLCMRVEDGRLVIERPDDSVRRFRGALKGAYGDVDTYIRELRSEWDHRP